MLYRKISLATAFHYLTVFGKELPLSGTQGIIAAIRGNAHLYTVASAAGRFAQKNGAILLHDKRKQIPAGKRAHRRQNAVIKPVINRLPVLIIKDAVQIGIRFIDDCKPAAGILIYPVYFVRSGCYGTDKSKHITLPAFISAEIEKNILYLGIL